MDTIDKPKFARPSGWVDGGAVWHPRTSATGMRYKCKSCGRSGSGYGAANNVDAHADDCPVTAAKRMQLAADAADLAARVVAARTKLYDINWTTMSDALVLRLAALLP